MKGKEKEKEETLKVHLLPHQLQSGGREASSLSKTSALYARTTSQTSAQVAATSSMWTASETTPGKGKDAQSASRTSQTKDTQSTAENAQTKR